MKKKTLLKIIERLDEKVDLLEDEMAWARVRISELLDDLTIRVRAEKAREDGSRSDVIE